MAPGKHVTTINLQNIGIVSDKANLYSPNFQITLHRLNGVALYRPDIADGNENTF